MIIRRPWTQTARNIYTTIRITAFPENSIRTRQKTVKKRQLILEVRQFWESLEKKRVTAVAGHLGISSPTAKRYIQMSAYEIESMDFPKNYKKRGSPMNKWLNVIFKMMRDGHSDETIYFYIQEREDFTESTEQLARYIYLIGKKCKLAFMPQTDGFSLQSLP